LISMFWGAINRRMPIIYVFGAQEIKAL